MTFDAAGRITTAVNALGSFGYAYAGASSRLASETFPNGQNAARSYGGTLADNELQRITYTVGATPISEFSYGRDIPAARITRWSQQAGALTPSIYNLGYDAADQVVSAAVTNSGALINNFTYAYDPAGNRLTELANGATNHAAYNALNELTTSTAPGVSHTNEWDAAKRIVAVTAGNNRTEFTYDGAGRVVSIRKLTNGSEVSLRLLVWSDNELCEERNAAGEVTKRFFPQGMRLDTGPNSGDYFYTRDHLGSIHELTDSSGNVRARYVYDPFGRKTKLTGDIQADFGFAGMFWITEASLALTRFRVYDPEIGRWLSRDPLLNAEVRQGVNLYAYVGNNTVNSVDRLGHCCEQVEQAMQIQESICGGNGKTEADVVSFLCSQSKKEHPESPNTECGRIQQDQDKICASAKNNYIALAAVFIECRQKPCKPPCPGSNAGTPPAGSGGGVNLRLAWASVGLSELGEGGDRRSSLAWVAVGLSENLNFGINP